MPPEPACFVFLGPTLPAAEAEHLRDAVYLPPVREGDVLRLVQHARPRAIGIVDGYFRAVPACWHKEILFALSEGVHVFGAASMGALRAAELDGFGMVGVGRIYEAYRSGEFAPFADEAFEGDDEVAIVHGPAETGYVAASEAMVDIRATLAEATASGILSLALRDTLAALAKGLPYPERSLARILAATRAQHPAELAALARWLPTGRIELKRADTQELLMRLRAFLADDPPPFVVGFRLESSAAWREALASTRSPRLDDEPTLTDLVRDEARLAPGGMAGLRRRAVERLAALDCADRRGLSPTEPMVHASIGNLRQERSLLRHQELSSWLVARDLDRDGLARLAGNEARLELLAALAAPKAGDCLLDLLRLEDGYLELRARALAKRDGLHMAVMPPLDDASVHDLATWHAMLSEQPPPPDVDAYARSLGFRDGTDLARALWREQAWRRHQAAHAIGPDRATA